MSEEDIKRYEVEAQLNLNTINAMSRSLIGPVADAPGNAAGVAAQMSDSAKRLRLPIRAPITSIVLDTIVKRFGRNKGMEDCGCK